jgi:hypothetical protein
MRMYVPLSVEEFNRLIESARVERRPPREQAAVLIARALGLMDDTTGQRTPRRARRAPVYQLPKGARDHEES